MAKLWNPALYFLLIPTLNFCIGFTDGLAWTAMMPSQINKCIGQTAHLSWKFVTEPGEEIRQLQWIFNSTEVIAYSSNNQGFNIDIKYQGRVEKSGETGILIYNLSTKDIGNYTLYPRIAWKTTPNIQSVWLNVIEPTMEHLCTCEKLQVSLLPFIQDLRSGQIFTIKDEGCSIQINSSFCCVKDPTIQYCESNPQKFCIPIRILFNLAKSTTQSRIVTLHTVSGFVRSQVTYEDPNKVSSSLTTGFRPWIKCNWSMAAAIIVVKYVLGF